MTWRSLTLGFAGALFLALFTFFNDKVMLSSEMTGNFAPFAVFGTLALFVLILNPLLARLKRRLAFSAPELAVAAGITLFSCFVPGRGLMHFFNNIMIMPQHYARLRPAWKGTAAELSPNQVRDWAALTATLGRGRRPDASATAVLLWKHLPAELRVTLEQDAEERADREDHRRRICQGVNAFLREPVDWQSAVRHDKMYLPSYMRQLMARRLSDLDPDERVRLNRGVLDLLAGGAVEARRPGPVESAPRRMLTDVDSRNASTVLDPFVVGMREGNENIAPQNVPFSSWIRPWSFWMPLVLTLSIAVIGLALVLHRQWVEHERLPYPTVQFLTEILPGEGGGLPATLRSRWFLAGMGVVLAIHLNNYLAEWWPGTLIPVRTYADLRALKDLFPALSSGPGQRLFVPRIGFAAFGFAYLLSRDISFSVGVAPWLYWAVVGTLVTRYGVDISAGYGTFSPGIQPSLHAGAYVAMFIALFAAAHRHLRAVFARALGLTRAMDEVRPHEIWGSRVFIVGLAAFVLILHGVGLPLWLGILYAAGAVVISTVVSRLLAEGGVFTTQSSWYTGALLWGLLGAEAVGPDRLLIMGILSSMLLITYREMVMGLAFSALRLCESKGVRPGKIALSGTVAVGVALVVAAAATLYWQYNYGTMRTGDEWIVDRVPTAPYENDVAVRRLLASQGQLGAAQAGKLGGLRALAPRREYVAAFAVAMTLVFVFTWCRRRFPGWPLHPLMFLVLGTNDALSLSASFLAGALVKTVAERYGGWRLCRNMKPLIFGLIAGEMIAGILVAASGAVYYWATGQTPVRYKVFLG